MIIPLIEIGNIVAILILAALLYHFWRQAREVRGDARALKSFALFFVVVLGVMVSFSLSGIVFRDLRAVQIVLTVADLLLLAALAVYAQFLTFLLAPHRKTLPYVILGGVGALGGAIWLWELQEALAIGSGRVAEIAQVGSYTLVAYFNVVPLTFEILIGALGTVILGTGAWIFFAQGIRSSSPFLRKRSVLIGAGSGFGALALFFNFIVASLTPLDLISSILAMVFAISSFTSLYRGALLQVHYQEENPSSSD